MLGGRIGALRRQAGYTQAELAQKLNVSASAMGMYEQGRREPAADTLVAMAALFGVSTDYLLTGSAATPEEEQISQGAMMHSLLEMDKRLSLRRNRPFSRQELTVLFAAMLMEP